MNTFQTTYLNRLVSLSLKIKDTHTIHYEKNRKSDRTHENPNMIHAQENCIDVIREVIKNVEYWRDKICSISSRHFAEN